MSAFQYAKVVGGGIEYVRPGWTRDRQEALKGCLLASEASGVEIGKVVSRHFRRLTEPSQSGTRCEESAVHVGISFLYRRSTSTARDGPATILRMDELVRCLTYS